MTRTELLRSLHAFGSDTRTVHAATERLKDTALIRLPSAVFDSAGALAPGTRLRSLDALHCAAALGLGPALTDFVAYDKRLIECAHALGLPARGPA